MYQRSRHLSVLLTTTLLAACDPADEPGAELEAEDESSPISEVELEAPGTSVPVVLLEGLDAEGVALGAPIVAIVPNTLNPEDPSDCAFTNMPNGWIGKRLLTVSPWMIAAATAVPVPAASPLHDFCVYTYAGQPSESIYTNFMVMANSAPPGEISDPATDAPAVAPLGALNTPDTRAAAYSAFVDSVGAPTAQQLDALNRQTSHVYILDTAQDVSGAYDNHAKWLHDLMIDISCADGWQGCKDQFHTMMIMPRRADDDFAAAYWEAGGGHKGYSHELALGIATAVQDWRSQIDNDFARGVLNISAGAPTGNSYATNQNKAPAKAVIAAANMAACYGLPIYAAAGNGTPEDPACNPMPRGLMFPANLETLARPTLAQCQAWGYLPDWNTNSYPVSGGATQGLVTAVNGVDHTDHRIANYRQRTTSRLQSIASFGVSTNDQMIATGTSLAAIGASVAHQLLWSVDAAMSPNDATQLLYTSGWSTGMTADAGRFQGQAAKRLSVCGALAQLPGGPTCAAEAPDPLWSDELELATRAAIDDPANTLISFDDSYVTGPAALSCTPGPKPDFIAPQPPKPLCEGCSVGKGTGTGGLETLYMSITVENVPLTWSLQDAYVHVKDSVGVGETFTLDADVVNAIDNATSNTNIETTFDAPNTKTATLEFVFDVSGMTVSEYYSLEVWEPTI